MSEDQHSVMSGEYSRCFVSENSRSLSKENLPQQYLTSQD